MQLVDVTPGQGKVNSPLDVRNLQPWMGLDELQNLDVAIAKSHDTRL